MRAILILYLTRMLLYTEAEAKIVYHAFNMTVYFFPLFGSIISDSWLGKFRTILYVSMIYATGSVLLAVTSVGPLHIPQREFTIFGLILIAVGTGGIKPCVSAFGGDQFILPQQELQLATFFSLFYFSINAGSLISTFLTPILRKNVHCFGLNSCYPLAFAVPGGLMIIAIVIFALGKPLYEIKQPKDNIIVQVVKCIWYAVTHRKGPTVDHWLDRSEPAFGAELVNDVKCLLKVLVLYVPLPVFWALYDQQASGWTFQAVRMDGDIGFYTILPDQMQIANPLLILIFIPVFTYGVYPLLAKCHLLMKPLQRICCGGFLTATAFAVSAVISMKLESTYPVLPSAGQAQIRIYDATSCAYSFTSDYNNLNGAISGGYYENKDIRISGTQKITFTFTKSGTCDEAAPEPLSIDMSEKGTYGIFLSQSGAYSFTDNIEKSHDGYPKLRVLPYLARNITLQHTKETSYRVKINPGNTSLYSMPYPGTYRDVNSENSLEITVKLGGTYTALFKTNSVQLITVTQPNSVHMLWLLPQYVIITAAEIMFVITGLQFSYSQAPITMKAVLQAAFLLTTACGNLIIVLIASAKIFEDQSKDFFLYAGLMVVDMLLFMLLAIRYKYVQNKDSSEAE
ncbi:peptide transporter family 1-like [Sitophilus oryzae]|uniref:Oligopeptide transporter 1 n=1 Tax=Sitophilus oryzae TaxID=7048 RepID=A0A6J2YT97_SITOR|nr:peptide transporter family 1-like [Sitophilus oryzae]XP_030766029.1 peptide transporter family 1-like [Sitophilus oryzae]XP_030766030.1 peptide transporter family 1-like [Sitophilus oryzae]XP_030766031.1 peptide transporter family 1-like [Sitophilus oryzae]